MGYRTDDLLRKEFSAIVFIRNIKTAPHYIAVFPIPGVKTMQHE